MSVLSYLSQRASDAVLSVDQKASIASSLEALRSRLDHHFGAALREHFRFGSSTRDTILPRCMDEHSDIDYMVVFRQGGSAPQTYLDRLRRFVEVSYQASEVYQSDPSVVLELSHIKFELVPALRGFWSSHRIPNGPSRWQDTDPDDFNQALEEANKAHAYLLKPTIRLAKFWNARNGYVFESFAFEKWIKDCCFFTGANQRDYLFDLIEGLPRAEAQWGRERIDRARQIVARVKAYEAQGRSANAEAEIRKLIPA